MPLDLSWQTTQLISCPFSSLAPILSSESELCWDASLPGTGVVLWLPRGDVDPFTGESPPTVGMDIDMEGMMVEEEARRLGSLQTEVGGATSAISGICWEEERVGKAR